MPNAPKDKVTPQVCSQSTAPLAVGIKTGKKPSLIWPASVFALEPIPLSPILFVQQIVLMTG